MHKNSQSKLWLERGSVVQVCNTLRESTKGAFQIISDEGGLLPTILRLWQDLGGQDSQAWVQMTKIA